MKENIYAGIFTFLLILIYQSGFSQSYVPERGSVNTKIQPAIRLKAFAFNLQDVKVNGGIFGKASSLDSSYLLSLKPDRFLYRFRLFAGLNPKDSIYGGWESRDVSGHSLGHYLSACSFVYASSGNKEFKERVDYIIDELALCQRKRKTGYVGAIPNEDSIFAQVQRGDIRTQGFDLNGGWVPWYTIHKIWAGLEDAYLYCHNTKALEILIRFAGWVEVITKNLNETQWQRMLIAEHGGMNEVLANLYSFTGDGKYLALSRKFYQKSVLDPLASRQDDLAGKHANTQIPKIIGLARLFELTASERDSAIASFFWNAVVHHHSYVIGGNSNHEHFTAADKLNDELSANTTETCNTYNMLKLTRHLFGWNPDAAYMDYYERALYNHILASQNNQTGMVCYYVPLQAGTKKQFGTPFESFWCCTGTGMENHVKYAQQIYSAGADGSLYVNLFITSTLNWRARKVQVEQRTDFPDSENTTLIIHSQKPVTFTMHIRRPAWTVNEPVLRVNGLKAGMDAKPGSWINITRTWKDGDRIELRLPMQIYDEPMPDNPRRVAFLYGPLVLAAKLPAQPGDSAYNVTLLVSGKDQLAEKLKKQEDGSFRFSSEVVRPFPVTLIPFYKIQNERQEVYFDVHRP